MAMINVEVQRTIGPVRDRHQEAVEKGLEEDRRDLEERGYGK